MANSEHLSSSIETVRHGFQASLALGAAVLACNMAKSPDAVAHEIDETNNYLAVADSSHSTIGFNGLDSIISPALKGVGASDWLASPVNDAMANTTDQGVPVTRALVDYFNDLVRSHWPNNPCTAEEETFDILPPEQMNVTINGEATLANGIYAGNCHTNYLSTATSVIDFCYTEGHEKGHEAQFVTKEPNRIDNFEHDTNPASIMTAPRGFR